MYFQGNTCSKQTTPSIYIQYFAVSSNTTILLSLYLLYLYIYNIFLCNNNILYILYIYNNTCDFHIFIDIFDDISPFHHFDHFFVNFFSCGVWGGCGGVAGLHRKVFVCLFL